MSTPWSFADFDAHEDVHFFEDALSGLRAIIAIHSTHRGPGAGGVRYARYSHEADAVADALRLSRGMSYKNAMAGLSVGGGKGVILANSTDNTVRDAQLRAFGDAIERLGGRYITAQDVGISEQDIGVIAERTPHVAGLPVPAGEAGGDPGPVTAHGVYLGICTAAKRALGTADMRGVRVAIQGIGSVGGGVARRLAADGAILVLADRDGQRADTLAAETGATTVPADRIIEAPCDVFSPNALGAILNETTIPRLAAKVVAGGANNQLATPEDAHRLHARDILYAPDYVINAGGIINVTLAYHGERDAAAVVAKLAEIPDRLAAIWDESAATGQPPSEVADAIARRLIGRA